MLLLTGCDFSTPEPPPTRGNQPNPRWQVDNGGASNTSYYTSKTTLPAGTELRIQVENRGELADVRLVNKASGAIMQSWPHASMANGQVLTHKLTAPLQPSISVGGNNYWHFADHISDDADIDTMKFDKGWVLKVRVVMPQL